MKSLAVTLGVVLLVFGLVSGANAGLISDGLTVMGGLFNEFQTAIEQQESDMTFFLTRLSEMNAISDALGAYLQGIASDADALRVATLEARSAAAANSALYDYAISLADNPLLLMSGLFDTRGIILQDLQDIYAYVPGSNFLPKANPVPEPASMLLFASGLAAFAVFRKRLKK